MKEKVIFISLMLLCVSVGYVIGLTNNTNTGEFVNTPEDNYFHTSLYKGYNMLTIPSNIEHGYQNEVIRVDNFLTFDDEGYRDINDSFGFLRVNETTNLIEFIEWNHGIGYISEGSSFVNFTLG